jgi:hypothetical protein
MAKHTLKSTLMYVAIMVAALILCLDDIEGWPADWNNECANVVRISDIMESPMGRTIIEVSVVTTGEYYGSDTSCANFAWCIRHLFEIYPKVLRVEILNPESEWVPSIWRSIDFCHADMMNSPWEEYSEYGSTDNFLADCYGDFDNLSYRND